MPGTTPIYGFPYPLGSDPVRDGDNDIRVLAENVETVVAGLGSYTNVTGQTFNGLSVGNGTVVSRYARVRNLVHFYGSVTLGPSSVVSSPVAVVLPFNAANGYPFCPSSVLFFSPLTPPNFFVGTANHTSPSLLSLYALNAAGTYANNRQMDSSIPFSWTTNCIFSWNHIYEAA